MLVLGTYNSNKSVPGQAGSRTEREEAKMMSGRHNFKAAMAVCFALGLPVTGHGATFFVGSETDAVDSNIGNGSCETTAGPCTLRAAVQEANATPEADTIYLPQGLYKLTEFGDNGEFDPAAGDLDIKGSVTIVSGDGAGKAIVDGVRASRVFEIWRSDNGEALIGNDHVVLDGLVIRNGATQINSVGGGVRAREGVSVTIKNCTVTDNRAVAYGGGIHTNIGNLTIENSIIERNKSDGMGAGIMVNDTELLIKNSLIARNDGIHYPPGNIFGGGLAMFNGFVGARIENSSFVENEATNGGGGIYVGTGELVMVNSTVSNNVSNLDGGGIYFRSDNNATVYDSKFINVTIAENTARGIYNQKPVTGSHGAGLYVDAKAKLKLQNTLIAKNYGEDCVISAFTSSLGNNLDSDNTCGFGQTSDQHGVTNDNVLLGGLADNGGPMVTHALLTGSPAIDAGNSTVCDTEGGIDQRYYLRDDGSCDIGAFEANATPGGEGQLSGTDFPLPPKPDNYQRPMAFWMPYTAIAGQQMQGVFSGASYNMEEPLTFEVLSTPDKGILITASDTSNIPELFSYTPHTDAFGAEYISYRACDAHGCSDPATLWINILSEQVVSDVRLDVVNNEGGTYTNPTGIQVVAQNDLEVIAPDIDYDYPLGAFFFVVNNIPEDANGVGYAEVVIDLPNDAEIPADAVIRKLDIRNEWRTLPAVAYGDYTSTAVIDNVNKTVTLKLYDNDGIFDRNPVAGIIDDPVALAVPYVKSATPPPEEEAAPSVSAPASGGGGSTSLLAMLALLPLAFRRVRKAQH